jgi:mannose-6-phosphate isomerase-like protein (cupin superfamily)
MARAEVQDVPMAPLFTRPRSSSTVTHGAALDFETLYPDGDLAPVRLSPHQDTLLRVVSGDVRLTVDRDVRLLGTGEEAIVPAGTRHRTTSLEGEARVIVGFRTR